MARKTLVAIKKNGNVGNNQNDHGDDDKSAKDITARLHEAGIRVSIFVDANPKMVEGAKAVGADRIEFYTGKYASGYFNNREKAIENHVNASKYAQKVNLGVNAGHDLSLDNIKFFKDNIPDLLEVSIGHALITESLYLGVENVIQMYLHKLK